MKKILALFLLLSLSGCAFVYQNLGEGDYSNLSYGMSKDEVQQILGSPQSEKKVVIVGEEYEVWEYPASKPQESGINTLGSTLHKVFFSGGKLVRWDKDKVIGQPSFEFQETQIPEVMEVSSSANKNILQEQNLK